MFKIKLKKFFLLFALAFSFTGFAETFAGDKIFSINLGYASTVLKNKGFTFGLTYEIGIFDFLAVRPGFSHMTLFPNDSDIICCTVGVNLDLLFYPFFKGLEGPYVAGRIGTDFVMFPNSDVENETAIMATPLLGWKFSVKDYVLFDIFCGYRFLLNKNQFSNEKVAEYFGNKFEYGLKVKLNLKKFVRRFLKRNNLQIRKLSKTRFYDKVSSPKNKCFS